MRVEGCSAIYAAMQRWKERCLMADGSILSDTPVWTSSALADFEHRFVVGFLEGDVSFYEKLQKQLEGASAAVVHLAAEMLWAMFLFPDDAIRATRKRADIRRVWAWAGTELPETHEMLSDAVLEGIAGVGTFFNTGRYVELQYFILQMKRWKALPEKERGRLIEQPYEFSAWLEESDSTENRMMRHIILHLMFPESFVAIASSGHKRKIIRKLGHRLPEGAVSRQESHRMPWSEMDRRLTTIETKLREEHKDASFHFYLPDVAPLWQDKEKVDEVPDPTPPLPAHVREPVEGAYEVEDLATDLFMTPQEIESLLDLVRTKLNVVLQGPPGVGKSYVARNIALMLTGGRADRIATVQFHQSYSYEDFVQGYRPSKNGFERRDGIFLRSCHDAATEPNVPFVLVIDEFNRGNVSRILGELMVLIEPDKRDARWAIELTYAQDGEQRFHVPANLYILGLMNTADRSLALVDYALRRRFAFVALQPRINASLFAEFLSKKGASEELMERIQRNVRTLNDQIGSDTQNLGPGYQIGHSYFCSLPTQGAPDIAWYERVIRTQIEPLLREYWFDQPEKAKAAVELLMS